MKKCMRFICAVCVLLMAFTCAPLSFAYDDDTQIIYSKTFDEYSDETAQSIIEIEEEKSFDEEKAKQNDYDTLRAVVSAPDIRSVSFARFSPEKVIFDETGTLAILVFENEKDTRYAVETLNDMPGIDYAQADKIITLPENEEPEKIVHQVENNYRRTLSWGDKAMQCDEYADFLKKAGYDVGITVAVIDSGCDMDHSFYEGHILSNGKDYVDNDNVPEDENGHGTHVTGTIIDCTGDLNVSILPVRVLNKKGSGSSFNISNAVNYAVKNGASVINMSLGGSSAFFEHYPYEDTVINNAYKSGVVCCVAAGNESEDCKNHCPAHVANAITVSAIDDEFNFASYSNFGEGVDICAPGSLVYSTYPDDSYAYLSGTSMATPHISAACAMIRLNYPEYSPNNVLTALSLCATDLGIEGKDPLYGNGLPQLSKLIDLHTHVGGDWIITKNATCGEEGQREVHCTICDKVMKIESVKPTGKHNFTEWDVVTKPTCTSEGFQTRYCIECSFSESEKTDIIAHDYLKTVVAPTCTENGYTVYKCKNCSLQYNADIIGSNGHSYETVVVPKTCTLSGYTIYNCKNCTYSYSADYVEPQGHEYEDIIVPKTCTDDGYTLHQCKNCSENYKSDYVNASHEMTQQIIEPTCTQNGYTLHQCSQCDYSYNDTFTPFASHKTGEWTVITPATAFKDGLEGQYCSVCKQLVNTRTLNKTGYVFEKKDGSKITIDEKKGLILGVAQGVNSLESELHLENCKVEYVETEYGFGTGTVLNLIVDGKIKKSYKIVIFGDVTGDGFVDSFDSSIVSAIANYEHEYDEMSPEFFASDLTSDGFVDSFDLSVINSIANYEMEM